MIHSGQNVHPRFTSEQQQLLQERLNERDEHGPPPPPWIPGIVRDTRTERSPIEWPTSLQLTPDPFYQ